MPKIKITSLKTLEQYLKKVKWLHENEIIIDLILDKKDFAPESILTFNIYKFMVDEDV